MRKTALILAFVVSVCLAAGGRYEENTVSVTAAGTGETENAAMYNALSRVVMKANGVDLASTTETVNIEAANQRGLPGFYSSSVFFSGELTRETIERSFEGYIKTFEVLSSEEKTPEEGSLFFEVKVAAEVYKYSHPVKDTTDKRARIVINTFKQEAGSLKVAERLESEINDILTSTAKFNVLEREYLNDFAAERNILLSDDASLADKARLAMVCGADYMISGTIRRFELEDALRGKSSKRNLPLYSAEVEVEYRLIIPATLQVRLSEKLEFTLEPREVISLWEKKTPADLELDLPKVKAAVAEMTAKKIADDVTRKVYPILVAHVQDDVVYLNEGGKRVKQGSYYNVFKKGKQLKDPQTNLSLGSTEEKIAAVKVDMVGERMSFAKVMEGNIDEIKTGDICRPVESGLPDTAATAAASGSYSQASLMGGELPEGEFRSKVEAFANKEFKPAKLAVLPLDTKGARFYYFGDMVSSKDIASKFEQYLITSLSKTGKFDLLDRNYESQYSKEVQLILDSSPIDNILGKLDKVQGADYIMVGRLVDFGVSKDSRYIEAASTTSQRYNAHLRLEYRIINLASREIAYSDQMDVVLDDEQLKGIVPDLMYSSDRQAGEQEIKYTVTSLAAGRTASKILEEMFPIRVVASQGDTIAINAGRDILEQGQKITVFSQGEDISDPYTGSNLGSFDSEAAVARITRTEAAVSYAQVLAGKANEGDICKPNRQIQQIQTGLKKSNIEMTPSGGVYLPQD